MIKSSLLEILGSFSLKEYRDFGEFVASPFFNKNEAVVKLYDYIRLHFPDLSGAAFEKESVFASIFPNVEYNDGFMRTIMFNLTQLAEDFLAYSNFKNRGVHETLHLVNELNNRVLDKQVLKNLRQAAERLDKYEYEDETYFLSYK